MFRWGPENKHLKESRWKNEWVKRLAGFISPERYLPPLIYACWADTINLTHGAYFTLHFQVRCLLTVCMSTLIMQDSRRWIPANTNQQANGLCLPAPRWRSTRAYLPRTQTRVPSASDLRAADVYYLPAQGCPSSGWEDWGRRKETLIHSGLEYWLHSQGK